MEHAPRSGASVTTTASATSRRSRRWAFALVAWVASTVGCSIWIARYKSTAGAAAPTPIEWPRESHLELAADRNSLAMFVHPQCPCSRASLTELNLVMNAEHERISSSVVFLQPEGVDADWLETDLWSEAGRIPGVTRIVDRGGVEASRFGAQTSGHVVLYDRSGKLCFSGGITNSRGHVGSNPGRADIQRIVNATSADVARQAVYGCGLTSDCDSCVQESGTP